MKSIFVTGAGSGIGLAVVRHFADRGWRVGMADLNLDALRRQAEALSGQVETFAVDVTDAASVARAVAAFSGDRPSIDVLFNSAGILDMRCFDQPPLARLHQIVDVNVTGVINSIHAALPHLNRSGAGARVITMGSASGLYGIPEEAVYSASKFAVRGLTEALNIEMAAQGIWVSDIVVAYVQTPMIEQAEHTAKSVTLLGYAAQPEQVAEVAWQAAHERRVHWYVGGAEAMQAHLESLDAEGRRAFITNITGFAYV
ncbi:SDR family NAD(P)-dependent oxidoreductase [Ideonella sp. B508-1]|uniref:SDR family NAD(P)-dependent oxidoreductase n=1 Tax=Ideonella sp. B508-1 TaxID=137716 RepID=UPI0003B4A195|nr:SDR family NAD(P)-dependent oxidoreductase [Ideonella sp. B508-1]